MGLFYRWVCVRSVCVSLWINYTFAFNNSQLWWWWQLFFHKKILFSYSNCPAIFCVCLCRKRVSVCVFVCCMKIWQMKTIKSTVLQWHRRWRWRLTTTHTHSNYRNNMHDTKWAIQLNFIFYSASLWHVWEYHLNNSISQPQWEIESVMNQFQFTIFGFDDCCWCWRIEIQWQKIICVFECALHYNLNS